MQTLWKAYQEKHKERFLNELFELLRIPSISAKTEHKADVKSCAEKVASFLKKAQLDKIKVYPTKGHPIVFGEKIIDKNLPTVLVYGHYDVQPVEPIELWKTDPFEPTIINKQIFARGSADDKGQFFMHIKALETMLNTQSLPCNVKIMIEGEEEVGSPNLEKFVEENKQFLSCDVILISDTAMISLKHPSIDVGVRGLSYIEVEVTGPNRDLHSGTYGGAIANPITILCQMIASLHDKNNHITIPHFYEEVATISKKERTEMAKVPYNETTYKKELGIKEVWGEKGFTTTERTGIRPTLEVNGIWGGYIGEGSKTVLPSKAYAKISCRLVPNQQTDKISKLLIHHLQKIAPSQVNVTCNIHHGGNPYVTPIESIVYQAAAKAIQTTFGKKPVPVRGGGSIPISALFENILKAKIVFMGFGFNNDNLHSPNEKYDLLNFYKGIETIPYFYSHFVELYKNKQ
ncbi:MAG: dipeptidase [Chitinophagaceae bacterium]